MVPKPVQRPHEHLVPPMAKDILAALNMDEAMNDPVGLEYVSRRNVSNEP